MHICFHMKPTYLHIYLFGFQNELHLGPLHIQTKGCDHKMLRALKTYPTTCIVGIESNFAWSWARIMLCEVKMENVEGPQHML